MGQKIREINASDKPMTNHQRILDRQMQRAFDAGSDLHMLPHRSRRRRGHYKVADLEQQQKDRMMGQNDDRLPVSGA